ncbi:response regulator [Shewanella waksmanii]|uniref:response regulator n=1 Tax=Shewanella waksmanii TaxID=213783 RepID=UPI000492121E|nr:response regulator [Shewanella waksmanii]
MSIKTLLVIEDDEFMIKQITQLSAAVGFTNLLVKDDLPSDDDYQQADLIITDINVPKISGIAHIDKIIQLAQRKPVVVISGLDEQTLDSTIAVLKLTKVNIVASFTKPFNRKDFKSILSQYS